MAVGLELGGSMWLLELEERGGLDRAPVSGMSIWRGWGGGAM